MRYIKLNKNLIRTPVIGVVVAAVTLATPTIALAHASTGAHPASYGNHGSWDKDSAHMNKKPSFKLADKTKLDCDAKQQTVNQQVTNYKASAQKQLGYLNNFFVMIQGYVTDNSLTVTDYATLQANATSAQTSATAAVNAVTAPDLGCGTPTNPQVAFNSSVKSSVNTLQVYKKSLVSLFTAVVNS